MLYNIEVNNTINDEVIVDENIQKVVDSYFKIKDYILENNPSLLDDLNKFKYDQKTGLLNRVGYFIEIHKQKVKNTNRAIIFFDADFMHDVNEEYSYDFVDKYLIEIGKSFKKHIRFEKKGDRGVDILGYDDVNTIFHRKNDSAGDEFILNIECNKKDYKIAKNIAKRYLNYMYDAQRNLSKKLNLF